MKDCVLSEINAKGYKKDKFTFESDEDWMKKTNLFLETDGIDVGNYIKLGLSIGRSKNKNF